MPHSFSVPEVADKPDTNCHLPNFLWVADYIIRVRFLVNLEFDLGTDHAGGCLSRFHNGPVPPAPTPLLIQPKSLNRYRVSVAQRGRNGGLRRIDHVGEPWKASREQRVLLTLASVTV